MFDISDDDEEYEGRDSLYSEMEQRLQMMKAVASLIFT